MAWELRSWVCDRYLINMQVLSKQWKTKDIPPRQISLHAQSGVFDRALPRILREQLRNVVVVAGGIVKRFPEVGRHGGKLYETPNLDPTTRLPNKPP